MDIDTIRGCIYGSSLGDAWGAGTEFKTYEQIRRSGLGESIPELLRITDDTQMSIYAIQAVEYILTHLSEALENVLTSQSAQDAIRNEFAEAFLGFYHDKDNNRAPGYTCMTSLSIYERSARTTGREGADNESRGCGTIMRTPWLGLLAPVASCEQVFALAVLSAQTTHGDPISHLAAGVAALLVYDTVVKDDADALYDVDVDANGELYPLIDHTLHSILTEDIRKIFINLGGDLTSWLELRLGIEKVREHIHWGEYDGDLSEMFGAGWSADEALYTSLAGASIHLNKPTKAMKRLVQTGGDSDSLASIGGAFLGALNGYESFSKIDVPSRLEDRYRRELADVIKFFENIHEL